MRTFWNKHKFIKVIKFNKDKTSMTTYYRLASFKPIYLINPNNVFNSNGYSTILITDESTENINPLDFKSKYELSKFQSAINNKLIQDTFNTLKSNKFDLTQIIVFGLILINIVMLYFILKMNGVF